MKKYTLLFLLVPMFAAAQENGIHFQHNTSWSAVKAKAKAEHKLIFMDCYTTWCGPCRYMSANIFPLEEVGKFMNEKFISVKVQLDTTAADNEEVKSWYKAGHDIASQYHIQAYPTYLFFDADGNAVHRAIGSGPAEDFIAKAKDALNPESQYYTLLNQYNRGQKDSAFLLKAATASMHAYDMETAKKLAEEYLATQNNLYTKTNLDFIINFTESSADKGFAMMLNNAAKVNEVLGKGMAENITMKIIMREEVFTYFSDDPLQPPDWNNISSAIEKKYPAQSPEILAKSKVIWYQYAKDWDNYQRSIMEFMSKYGDNVMPADLNEYAWSVFLNCSDMDCVEAALEWSKRSFEDKSNPAFIDTYANLLYKLGKKDEALQWEQKALDLAPDGEKKGYEEVIEKMKAGEKTWN